jgi:hypothetical protein
MSFQRYPIATVQKVSQFIRETLVLPSVSPLPLSATDSFSNGSSGSEDDTEPWEPDSLDALGDLFRIGDDLEEQVPAPNVEGRWYISTINPGDSLLKLPGLWLRAGIRLVTYLQRYTDGGVGMTWALPELLSTTEYLDAAIESAGQGTEPPHPIGALTNLTDALEGDGSLSSFLSASIFLREVREFGRFGPQARWTHHRFVAEPPPKVTWQWRTKPPQDFSPKVVTLSDGQIVVEFFTCRVMKPIALFRHVDRYPATSYHAQTADQVIAIVGSPNPPGR